MATFDGLDELRSTLADLKAKRDALEARRKQVDEPVTPALSEKELRAWALEQFARLDDLTKRTDVDLKDRQMIEAFVQRIEVNPEKKTGVVYLMADLENAFRVGSTRLPGGDRVVNRGKGLARTWPSVASEILLLPRRG